MSDTFSLETTGHDLGKRVGNAVSVIYDFGGIEGDHHRCWVIDQTLRALLEDQYEAFIAWYERDGDYSWETGIAP